MASSERPPPAPHGPRGLTPGLPGAAATEAASGEGWLEGWWPAARACPSPNAGERPAGTDVALLVVHSISLPPGHYGGDAIERLFTNRLNWSAHPYFEQIRGLEVSAHFLVRRDGGLLQFVSCDRRAWHAGASRWRGRDHCNDWSIGVELEGLEGDRFEAVQYAALARLAAAIVQRYPVREAVGHGQVSPGRKIDPGPGFDWSALGRQPDWPALVSLAACPAVSVDLRR